MTKPSSKHRLWSAAILGTVALTLALLLFGVLLPYLRAETAMPQGVPMELLVRDDGAPELTWPAADRADAYVAEVLRGEEILWSDTVSGTSCVLPPDLPAGELTLRVNSCRSYRSLMGERSRPGSQPLTAQWSGRLPALPEVTASIDPDDDVLTLTWPGERDGLYTVRTAAGDALLAETDSTAASILFSDGPEGILPAIGKGDRTTLYVFAALAEPGVTVRRGEGTPVDVNGEDFLGTVLKLDMTDGGDNFYTLRWNETRGEHYEIQERDASGEWETLRTFTDSEELTYTVGPLPSFSSHTLRVVALGGHTLPDSDFAAIPAEVTFTTGATTRYATIWVLKDLDIYADTARTEVVGRATLDRSYCVMGEEDGMFLIYFDGGRGYIDSTYCLINLPDYLGELCAYDITNSYDAIYKVHDYGIPEITGTVVTGYEEVASGALRTRTVLRTVLKDPQPEPPAPGGALPGGEDEAAQQPPENAPDTSETPETPEDGDEPMEGTLVGEIWSGGLLYEVWEVEEEVPAEFFVPLLYPTAKKVAQAAQAARADGYRLKIYDAYRPWIATRFLYDQTESLLNEEIPEYVYTDMAGDAWADYVQALLYPPEESADTPEDGAATDGGAPADTAPPDDGGDGADPDAGASTDDTAAPDNGASAGDTAAPDDTASSDGAAPDGASAPDSGADTGDTTGAGEPEREPRMSVYTLMTDGRHSLSAFLARSGSMHNLGVAVDLTLETLDGGEELAMQTAMHDLSWYSVLSQNNDNADLLAKYMTGCGLGPLTSEWWHFQDDELKASADLVTRQQGVTRAGWVADNNGWRYRTAEGEYLAGGTYTVDGRRYTFDSEGYSDYAAWESASPAR